MLYQHQLEPDMSSANINSVAPESTTAALAAQVPKEQERREDVINATILSAAPGTTTADLAGHPALEREASIQNAAMSSAAPESTTTQLAGQVRKETDANPFVSSAAPQSTTAQLAGKVKPEETTPSLENVPGFFPETPAMEAENPTESLADKHGANQAEQTFAINPLPASDTAENPITLAPGEPVPRDITTQSLTSNVKLDKESYEAGATNYPIGNLVLPDVVTPAEQREKEGRGVLDFALPPVSGNMIPESSLPMGTYGQTTSHVDTAVPGIVRESQQIAHASPEASEVRESVEHKHEAEEELQHQVPVVAPTATGDSVAQNVTEAAQTAGYTAAGAAKTAADYAGPAVVAAAEYAQNAAQEAADYIVPAAQNAAETTKVAAQDAYERAVPAMQNAAETTKVAAQDAYNYSAPIAQNAADTTTAAAYNAANTTNEAAQNAYGYAVPVAQNAAQNAAENTKAAGSTAAESAQNASQTAGTTIANAAASAGLSSALGYQAPEAESGVPEIVKDSQEEANAAPEASASPLAVDQKADVEKELKAEVTRAQPSDETTIASQAKAAVGSAASTLTHAAAATGLTTAPEQHAAPVSSVPDVVQNSMAAADAAPEAASNQDQVLLKEHCEEDLTSRVPPTAPTESSDLTIPTPRAPSPAPEATKNAAYILNQTAPVVTDGVRTGTTAPISTATETPDYSPLSSPEPKPLKPATSEVPSQVSHSLESAGASAEAASSLTAIHSKNTLEAELKQETTPTAPAAASTPVQAVATSGIQDVKPSNGNGHAAVATDNGHTATDNGHAATGNGHTTQTAIDSETEPKTAAPVQPQPIHTSVPEAAATGPEVSPSSSTKKAKRRSIFGRFRDNIEEKLHLRKKSN